MAAASFGAAQQQPSAAGWDAGVSARARAWVGRTLAPGRLRFCPYTGSEAISGIGLEPYGVSAAPIYFATSEATELRGLMRDFWAAAEHMLSSGEAEVSSIVLSAPEWDGRWEAWCQIVFLVLEASLLASGLSRTLGVVCFHPQYATPPVEWLARHRFGHMHSTQRLRAWLDQHDPTLSAASTDDAIEWAGSVQRRSPHAMINGAPS